MIEEIFAQVASVGAGYTTCLAGPGGVALVDIGARRSRVALAALERMCHHSNCMHSWWPHPWRPWLLKGNGFSEFVISHPHADHYCGLLALAGLPAAERPMGSLIHSGGTFFHPRIPDNPEADRLFFALAAVNMVLSAVPEYALGSAISACSTGPIARQPLVRGDTFLLGGLEFDVLWPPILLDDSTTSRLKNLVRAFDSLAMEAHQSGDTRLVRALEAVRKRAAEIGVESAFYEVTRPGSDHRVEVGSSEFTDYSTPQGEDEQDTVRGSINRRAQQLREAISRGANLLSLAFTSSNQHYVFLGDLDESLHPQIAGDLADRDHELVISAHHGTHWGQELTRLRSRYVVSSVGPPLDGKVRREWDQMGIHLRTDRAGDIAVWISRGEAHVCTCPADVRLI